MDILQLHVLSCLQTEPTKAKPIPEASSAHRLAFLP